MLLLSIQRLSIGTPPGLRPWTPRPILQGAPQSGILYHSRVVGQGESGCAFAYASRRITRLTLNIRQLPLKSPRVGRPGCWVSSFTKELKSFPTEAAFGTDTPPLVNAGQDQTEASGGQVVYLGTVRRARPQPGTRYPFPGSKIRYGSDFAKSQQCISKLHSALQPCSGHHPYLRTGRLRRYL